MQSPYSADALKQIICQALLHQLQHVLQRESLRVLAAIALRRIIVSRTNFVLFGGKEGVQFGRVDGRRTGRELRQVGFHVNFPIFAILFHVLELHHAGEGGEEDVGSDETSGNGTDSDEAEAELREETPLFRSMGNPAASSTSLAKGAKTITKGGSKQVQQKVQQKVTKGGAAQQQVQQKVKRQVQQDDADDDKDEEDDEEDDDQDEEDDDNNEDELAGTSDGRVSALDGRAERLRKGLQDSIRPLKERSDKLMDMQHLDTEDFLGTGAKFKGEIRTHAAEAKTVQREIKVVHKRLNVSTKPSIFKAEQDVVDEIMKVTNAVSSACKIIIDAVC